MKLRGLVVVVVFIFLCVGLLNVMGIENSVENFYVIQNKYQLEPENKKVECKCDNSVSDGECCKSGCGWNNSVSSSFYREWAPEDLKNKLRVFKYPHYYGYGTGSGFHYGEPYYVRKVNY